MHKVPWPARRAVGVYDLSNLLSTDEEIELYFNGFLEQLNRKS